MSGGGDKKSFFKYINANVHPQPITSFITIQQPSQPTKPFFKTPIGIIRVLILVSFKTIFFMVLVFYYFKIQY